MPNLVEPYREPPREGGGSICDQGLAADVRGTSVGNEAGAFEAAGGGAADGDFMGTGGGNGVVVSCAGVGGLTTIPPSWIGQAACQGVH